MIVYIRVCTWYLKKNWRSHAFYFIGFQVHSEQRGSHMFLLYIYIEDKFMEYCDSKIHPSTIVSEIVVATCKLRVIMV